MNSKDIQYIAESYSQIVSEQGTDLEALRQAAAKATLAGPSKEAQALMSSRTKTLLGPEKLKAGIEAQKNVEAMKSGQSSISAPAPKSPTPPSLPTPAPKSPTPPTSPTLTAQQQALYNRATGALQNPFTSGMARQKVLNTYNTMSQPEKDQLKAYLRTRPQKEQDLYKFIPEEKTMKTFFQFMEQFYTEKAGDGKIGPTNIPWPGASRTKTTSKPSASDPTISGAVEALKRRNQRTQDAIEYLK